MSVITMRIMGLDYGSKTVGVAVSDALGLTAQGIEIVRRKSENKLRQTLARIEEIAKEYGVEKIVLGFPKHMNNDISSDLSCMWDERLTTVEADRTMMETGIRRENRKEYVDMIAAVFILQGYLDYLSHQKESQEN